VDQRIEVTVVLVVSWLLGPAISAAALAMVVAMFVSIHGSSSSYEAELAELRGEAAVFPLLSGALAGLVAT
jgi:hypothetical protein